MIEELRIRGLGVIEDARIPFQPGLTVLTGETGAGKTMVLTGLELIRGGRADSGLVRSGVDRADVDGQWLVEPSLARDIRARLEELGAVLEPSPEGDVLILGRSVATTGRSRAIAGGRTVPAATLAELTEGLLAVHGQADQLGLRDPRRQRELVDRFAGRDHMSDVGEFARLLESYRATVRELSDLRTNGQERAREAALLRHGIEEIDAVAPEPDEDGELKALATLLAGATDVVSSAGEAHIALAGGDGGDVSAVDLLTRAIRALQRAEALDPAMAPLISELTRLVDGVGIVAGELAGHVAALDADPERLARVEDRRRQLSDLKRRYGPTLADVLQWRADAEQTVSVTDGAEGRIEELESAVREQERALLEAARALTQARKAAAQEFSARVSAELHELAMPEAQVSVDIRSSDDVETFTAAGADTVTLLLTPHRGSDPRPITAGASGGELSRVMLAIEVVLAGENPVPTFVFDEVDAGIGGRVAVEVGRRLSRLARAAQVLVVTHLPQVAAFADTHIVVTKGSAGQITESSVTIVDGPDRVRELVRMLSGLEDSASGAEHATELLDLAAEERASAGR